MNEARAQTQSLKKCHICKQHLPVADFYADKSRRSGTASKCKTCSREYLRTYMSGSDKWKKSHREKERRFRDRHKERSAIYTAVHKAKLLKASCERCERSDVRLVGHHPDYSKPLEVITLCGICHAAAHKELRNVTA